MELSELIAYAEKKYKMQEQHKWAAFPGFSVLCHPRSGKWVALLMQQWDTETGTQIERCDLKCGVQSLMGIEKPYLSAPIRMRGQNWIGVSFTVDTEPDVVFRLFDQAIASGEQRGVILTLDSSHAAFKTEYRDTALPLFEGAYRSVAKDLPARIRQMHRMFTYRRESIEEKAKIFYKQAKLMEDYEDDAPWYGNFHRYFPTYQDLTTAQLRGYFSWRTHVRNGEFSSIATSAAYLYIYEILNGIGATSPEDSLQKLKEFEAGYLDSGIGEGKMRQNLRRWMMEFSVIHGLSPETARQVADPELLDGMLH